MIQWLLEMMVASCSFCKTKVDSRLPCDLPKICCCKEVCFYKISQRDLRNFFFLTTRTINKSVSYEVIVEPITR